ncbi:signal peptidase I [Zavarzinella formosa]|uniref:signal peptidase I n=1 Tax=Zavarzinella formosa TaxID=360055 RepID=UPI0004984EF9|nr:signal peptidase I [Zavarzinella formosa]
MSTLMIVLAVFVGSVLFSALFLWFGARWVKAPKPYYSRALVATVINSFISLLNIPVNHWLEQTLKPDDSLMLVIVGAVLLGQLLVSWLVIARVIGTTYGRAIRAWLVSLVAVAAMLAALFLVVKPYVFESYVNPTNSMAPTIVGWHTSGVCPECGGELIVSAPAPDSPRRDFPFDPLGICNVCRKANSVKPVSKPILGPDRILVDKLITAKRWDIVVFRLPEEPSVKYVKRLVGLPGETVYIKDGAIWVNEIKQALPPTLAGLQYLSGDEVGGGMGRVTGTLDNPWRLGADEYVVLGDFSESSSDSRFWGPVPGANIEGVVTVCYWPVSRWKIHR